MPLTYQRLREVLTYEPGTGIFRWKKITHPRANFRPGDVAGATDERGFTGISIDGRRYSAARLAVFWMTKHWPTRVVDRADRNSRNTAWSNLRPGSLDKANSRRNRNRLEGDLALKGAYLIDGKYRAAIHFNGRTRHLGTFATAEEAHRVYYRAAQAAFGAFACDGREPADGTCG